MGLTDAIFQHYLLMSICAFSDTAYNTFYPTALRAVRVLFSPMGGRAGGRAVGRAAGNSLSGLYLRNRKV